MIGRRIVVPLVVAGSVAVGGVAGAVLGVPGLSSASTTSSATKDAAANPGGRRGAELDAVAKALNMTTAELTQKLSDGKTTIADIAKERNVDINVVINAIVGVARGRAEQFVNNPLPKVGMHGRGPDAARRGFGGAPFFSTAFDAAAKAVGISSDQLKTDMRGGKSIAQVAKDHDVDANTVITAMVTAVSDQLNQAVTDGKLTKERAAAIKNELQDKVTKLVNGAMRGGFGGHGMHGPHGPGGPGDGAPPDAPVN